MSTTLAAFVGAFAAWVALNEIQHSNRLVKYGAAMVCGIALTVIVTLVSGWVLSIFHQAG